MVNFHIFYIFFFKDMGIVIYTPIDITNPDSFADPERNKTIYDGYNKVIMRVLMYFKTPIRISVVRPDNSKVEVDDTFYTWDHLAIFET